MVNSAAEHVIVRHLVFQGLALDSIKVRTFQTARYGWHDLQRDIVLNLKHFSQLTIVAFCPDVITACRLNQLSRDPNPIARFANAALEHVDYA